MLAFGRGEQSREWEDVAPKGWVRQQRATGNDVRVECLLLEYVSVHVGLGFAHKKIDQLRWAWTRRQNGVGAVTGRQNRSHSLKIYIRRTG